MAEPTAPQIPNGAPQEVKDFFGCTGDRLAWRPGEVTWLGLQVTPSVDFTENPRTGGLTINVSILMGMVSFGLPATINAAGELVLDTSSVPDMSEWNMGGRQDIDAAIKNINDWFRKNGKKLKPHKLENGAVTLEKVPITAPPTTRTATTPTPAPVRPTPPRAAPAPVLPPPAPAVPGSGCGLLGILMIAMLVGVVALGAGVGFMFLGDPAPAAQATATPSTPPTVSPAARPAATVAASPSAGASATPTVAPTPITAASPTASPGSAIAGACVRVVHQAVGDFLSYLDWYVYMFDEDIDFLEVVVEGANNGEPVALQFDSPSGAYYGILGLHAAGAKKISSATLVLLDGTEIDVTDDLANALGGKRLIVRFPQEDEFGNCSAF